MTLVARDCGPHRDDSLARTGIEYSVEYSAPRSEHVQRACSLARSHCVCFYSELERPLLYGCSAILRAKHIVHVSAFAWGPFMCVCVCAPAAGVNASRCSRVPLDTLRPGRANCTARRCASDSCIARAKPLNINMSIGFWSVCAARSCVASVV